MSPTHSYTHPSIHLSILLSLEAGGGDLKCMQLQAGNVMRGGDQGQDSLACASCCYKGTASDGQNLVCRGWRDNFACEVLAGQT